MSDSNRRDVELRIRARDLSTVDLNHVSKSVADLTALIEKQSVAAEKGQIKYGELSASMARLKQASEALLTISGQIDLFKKLTETIGANQAAVEKARNALTTFQASLAGGTAVKDAEAKLEGYNRSLASAETKLATTQKNLVGLSETLRRNGVDINNLAAAERQLITTSDALGAAITKTSNAQLDHAENTRKVREASVAAREEQKRQTQALKDFNEETVRLAKSRREAAAQALADRRALRETVQAAVRPPATTLPARPPSGAPRRTGGEAAGDLNEGNRVLGFRPYEWTNLGYQINDIVSGLISGQRATQIAAQQGGQVLQIFNSNILSLIKYLPLIAVGVGAVTVAFGALNAAVRENSAQRQFGALLGTVADGARYSQVELVKLQHQIRDLGVTWDEAGQIIRQAIRTGLNQDRIKEFAEAAVNLHDIFQNISIPDAFKGLTESFSQGLEGIREWNKQFDILTPRELERITRLYEEKKASEGLALAAQIVTTRLKENGKDAVAPTTQAMRELAKAWNGFTDELSKTGIVQTMVDKLRDLTTFVSQLSQNLQVIANDPAIQGFIKLINMVPKDPIGSLATSLGANRIAKTLGVDTSEPAAGNVPTFDRFNPGKFSYSTPELQKARNALGVAAGSTDLPPGYKVVVISTERTPGAPVEGTNTPSQHGDKKAIDVVIVDANGNRIPGSMGSPTWGFDSTGLYKKLDESFEAAIAKMFPGEPYAIGGRFTHTGNKAHPDPGHYSVGQGSEQLGQSAREGRATEDSRGVARNRGVFTPTSDDISAGNAALDVSKRRLQIQYDQNEAVTREAIRLDALAAARSQGIKVEAQQNELAAREVAKFDAERAKRQREFQSQVDAAFVSDKKHAEEILAAGLAGRKKAFDEAPTVAGVKQITIEDLNRAQTEAAEIVRKRYAVQETYANEGRAFLAEVESLIRGGDNKSLLIENRIKAVTEQYAKARRDLEKLLEDPRRPQTLPGGKTFDQLKSELDQGEAVAKQTAEYEGHLAKINALMQERNELVKAYDAMLAAGTITQSDYETKVRSLWEKTKPGIDAATDAATKFIGTANLLDSTKIDLFNAKLAETKATAEYVSPLFKTIKEAFETSFVSGLSTAANTVSAAIGGLIAGTQKWKDVLTATRNAALTFFADLLKAIGNAILRYEALQVASSLGFGADGGAGAGGGVIGFLANLISGGSGAAGGYIDASGGAGIATMTSVVAHGGGVAGQIGTSRRVPASWFVNAPRYHSGTYGVGLAPDEQAAILQRGEEVLRADNPRHIANQRGGELSIRNVLVQREEDIAAAMAGAHGERVIMSVVNRNTPTIRQNVRR